METSWFTVIAVSWTVCLETGCLPPCDLCNRLVITVIKNPEVKVIGTSGQQMPDAKKFNAIAWQPPIFPSHNVPVLFSLNVTEPKNRDSPL